ncbi:MAG: AbrB/MazE/SpoVT family DNA-binding domain-containing protein [Clostridia bacterium]|nr:AbrB/MazE/SpoVT family DNA-binding domain-containing protein [Clostridia bacterium]
MKSTGIVRKIDELGRIVLPIEMRNRLEIGPGIGVEIFFEDSSIILRKYLPSCIFCNETEGLIEYKGRKVCKRCIDQLGLNK